MELETADPIVALKDKSIHTRCAGCRDLSQVGTLDALPVLAEKAGSDKSPAVRLCAAGAAADILSRYRMEPARAELDDAARAEVLQLFRTIDPGVNAGLFSMLACLDIDRSFSRIATGLRDPRGDVRVGAGVGLLRLAISGSRLGDLQLESDLLNLLVDKRLKPDAVVEVARVCVAAGYRSVLDRLSRLDLGESAHAEALVELQQALERLDGPAVGLWWSDGRDAGEVRQEAPLPPALRVGLPNGDAVLWEQGAADWTQAPPPDQQRRMWFRRVGKPAADDALQERGRTWYRADLAEVQELITEALGAPTLDWAATEPLPGAQALAEGLLPTLEGDDAASDRLRAVLLQRAGQVDDARAMLESAVTKKKLPPDTWFFLGEARHAAGDTAGAREAWSKAEKKAKRKRDWQVARARARLAD